MKDFTCGCCGAGFMSTYEEQRVHDQDEGFGFCPGCLEWMDQKHRADMLELVPKLRAALNVKNQARLDAMSEDQKVAVCERLILDGKVTYSIRGN